MPPAGQPLSRAFGHYLRTGRRLIELKFNPNHDPENGRFTFSTDGAFSGRGSVSIDLRTGVQTHGDGSMTIPLDPPRPFERPYRLKNSSVIIPADIEPKVSAIGKQFKQATGRTMTVVSGTRTAAGQAEAMFIKFSAGATGADYKNRAALHEVRNAYLTGRAAGRTSAEIVASMQKILGAQVRRGVIISPHMTGRAIDIRTNGPKYSAAETKSLHDAIRAHGGMILTEGRPPHIHVQFR